MKFDKYNFEVYTTNMNIHQGIIIISIIIAAIIISPHFNYPLRQK
jgi:hypothetical protein